MIKTRFLEFINKIKHLPLKQIIILSVCAVLIIVYMVLGWISTSIIDSLVDQNEGDRWENDETEMAQINVYFTEQNAVSESDIQKFEYNLTQNLTGADLVADTSENSSSRIYADCYSSSGSATIVHGTKALEVSAYGVGGDFFMFHPLTLISGSYFTSDSMMEDNIVIDEITAWQLFGSSNIVGEQVLIGDVPHFISGVVRNDDDKFSKAAGLTGAIV
ncbi:MAG: ABC transporter permease, partial [Butyrivibrio sp.]|nr:ABC transporter permease [Butyrivibrio sp.]